MSRSIVLVTLLFVAVEVWANHRELTYVESSRTESVRLYGNIHKYAYWFTDLLVGTPPQRTSVIVDTGSVVCAFPCTACGDSCGKHIDPPFNFEASSTAEWEQCDAECPGSCLNNKCSYSVFYSEGSSIAGSWFSDIVQLGDWAEKNVAVRSQVGCHVSETKLFYSQTVNGILGLAPRRIGAFPTIIGTLFDDPLINKYIFSLCLSPEGGELTVGGYNASHLGSSLQWIPMDTTAFYSVRVNGISIGSSNMSANFGDVIIDSGTTLVFFPNQIFVWLFAYVDSLIPHPHTGSGKCWNITTGSTFISSLPSITLSFEGSTNIPWGPSQYLYHSSGDVWCIAFGDNGAVNETILGAAWLVEKLVVFNIVGKKLGVSDNAKCPVYDKRRQEEESVVAVSIPIVETTTTREPYTVTKDTTTFTTEKPTTSTFSDTLVSMAPRIPHAKATEAATTTAPPSTTPTSAPDSSDPYIAVAWTGWLLALLFCGIGVVLFVRRRKKSVESFHVVVLPSPPRRSINDIELGVINNKFKE